MNQTLKYYDLGKDNTYCVHFSNKHGLSIGAIKDIFTEWGNVVGVTKAGDDYGLRFVRYKTEDDAIRCIEATRNHPFVRILPKRRPQQSTEQNNTSKNTNNNTQDTPNPWGSAVSKDHDESNLRKIESRNNNNSIDKNKFFETTAKSPREVAIRDDNSRSEKPPNIQKARESVSSRLIVTNLCKNSESEHTKVSSAENLGSFEDTLILKNPAGSVFPSSSKIVAKEIPDLVRCGASREQQVYRDLTHRINSTLTTANEQIVDAEQVVVANIPTDCSENLILHLLRKYDPICIYPIKMMAFLAIRYCVVYFASAGCVKNVISEFDNVKVGKKNLILLRPRV